MPLRDDIKMLVQAWKDQESTLKHNAELFDIFEGNLLPYLLADLKVQLSEKAYESASKRVPPINVLKRLVDKLSKIYEKAPLRDLVNGSDAQKKVFSELLTSMDFNTGMGGTDGANGLFNLMKRVWVQPFIEDGKPQLRVHPADRFFVVSTNPVSPTKPTHVVFIMGKYMAKEGNADVERTMFYGYTTDEFLVFNDKEEEVPERMAAIGSDGTNPLGELPGVYINRSKYSICPKPDTDTLAMTKLIPVLLTDLNYALMYQVFSILYTIDVDQSNLVGGPNALWDLKSKAGMGQVAKPEVGVVKPEVDSDKALDLIRALFSLWMETRNIKAGAGGSATVENAASAISKIVDEMDTSGDRKDQVPFFKAAEQDLLTLILTKYHPFWRDSEPEYEFRAIEFDPKVKVAVTFAEQRPMVDTSKAIDDQVKKLDAQLQTIEGALRELYPDATDEEITKKLAALKAEKAERDADAAKAFEEAGMTQDGQPPAKSGEGGKPPFPPKAGKKKPFPVEAST